MACRTKFLLQEITEEFAKISRTTFFRWDQNRNIRLCSTTSDYFYLAMVHANLSVILFFFNSQLRALILSSFLLLFFSTSLLLYLYIKFCEYPTIQWRIVAWKLKNIVCSCKRKADIDKLNPSSTSCFQTLWYEIVVHSL